MVNPGLIIICKIVVKIFCFSIDTNFTIRENNKDIKKQINEVKEGDSILVHMGEEKRYAKVLSNQKVDGKYEFYHIKLKSLKEPEKTKEIKVTGEHIMITFGKKDEINLVHAKNLQVNEFMETDDGLYKIYEITKEIEESKYFLFVKGGVVYANNIFVSTICSDEKAQIIKPTKEEWQKFQDSE